MNIQSGTYENTRVPLDGHVYNNCTFVDCELVYSGNGPVGLSGCIFRDCSFSFSGPAANAVAFLNSLAGDPGLREALTYILPNLTSRRRLN